jgi:hypothetical protein
MYRHSTKSNPKLRRHLWRSPIFMPLFMMLLLAACSSLEPAASAETPAPTNTPLPATPTISAPAASTPMTSQLGSLAFVRDGVLYLQSEANAEATPVEECSPSNCLINHLKWSPTGEYLLYYIGSYDGTIPHQIRLASAGAALQIVTEEAAYVQPAAWSPDGSAIAFRTDTDRYADAGGGPARRIQELWTATINADGALGEPQLRGEVTFGEGCGGGGRSESANLYEREGGFAYGYLSGTMAWTATDILLYSDNCTTRGVGRFDLANNVALEPYPGGLRSLSLNGAADMWVAINDQNQIVMGTPDDLAYTNIESSAPPEMVAFGKHTGMIYYTTLEITGGVDLLAQGSETLDPSIPIFAYFDTTHARLFSLDLATGTESELYTDDAYAYARIAESAEGGLLFSRIESNAELQAAVENGEMTIANYQDYLPTVDVLYLAPGSSEVTVLTDAEQFTAAQ